MKAFDLKQLLRDVFQTQPGEKVLVACDLPGSPEMDHPRWAERRAMAAEWREAFVALGKEGGFEVLPLMTYAATGANNGELPQEARLGDRGVPMEATLLDVTLACFLTQYSATAPLDAYCKRKEDFRAASLPGVEKRMEQTALAADYVEVARRCKLLDEALVGATALDVRFSTGQSCRFDLRYRRAEVDDGFLPRFKGGDRIINLPSGETFIVPYEGERPGEPSQTRGELPIDIKGEQVVLTVEANRILSVAGTGPEAEKLRQRYEVDPARRNIAEVAFGCNDWAKVTGNTLEDEKAGFHWAFGRSEHLGGTVGPKAFLRPENVLHIDVVYAKENPITISRATLTGSFGTRDVIVDGTYRVF